MILKIIWLQNAVIKTVLSKKTFKFLGIVQDVPHIFITDFVILVRRLLNFLTNDLIITGFVRVAQNPLYTLSLLKKVLKKNETIERRIKKLKKIIHLSLALWKP